MINYFIKQKYYKSEIQYTPLYINGLLYEQLFEKKYDYNKAFVDIQNKFSITLTKNQNELGYVDVDKQMDPLNISLAGNKGSGRAFFFEEYYNIKGIKTKLATSLNPIYNNGKYSLSAVIQETVIANILHSELSIKPYETLAILDIHEMYNFQEEILDFDNEIKKYNIILPCAIEIRVYRNNEFYRISNALFNNDINLETFIDNSINVECQKFYNRFIHGSWSLGNISVEGNLIDFDTSYFVKTLHPQYTNTNKYMTNYYGYEYKGLQLLINQLTNINIEEKYEEYMLEYFLKILYLEKDINSIDLFYKFIDMSHQMYNNPNGCYAYNDISANTAIFDFYNFFQNYPFIKKYKNSKILGLKFILNNFLTDKYISPKLLDDKVHEFFNEYIVDNNYNYIQEAISFIELYNKCNIKIDPNLNYYIFFEDRKYLHAYDSQFMLLTDMYMNKKISAKKMNDIINLLIKSGIRQNKKEYYILLEFTKKYIIYITINNNDFILNVLNIKSNDFAKCIIDDNEYMMKYNKNTDTFSTLPINYKIENFIKMKIKVIINGIITLDSSYYKYK